MAPTAPLTRTLTGTMPAAGAAVAQDQTLGACPIAGTVSAVTFTPEAALAGNATNTRNLSLVNKGQTGAGSTVVATLPLAAGVNLAAFDEAAATLSAVTGATTVAAGDVLVWVEAVTGTGLASAGGLVSVTIAR